MYCQVGTPLATPLPVPEGTLYMYMYMSMSMCMYMCAAKVHVAGLDFPEQALFP